MMEDIYRRITGSSRNFSRWDDAEENFIELEWDEETSRHFLESARDAVEQDRDTLSQAYLDIKYPDEFDTETVASELEAHSTGGNGAGREGFSYTVRDDGIIEADFYYYKEDVHVTSELEIDTIPDQKRIPLRIISEMRLVIVRNTQPSKVVKINSEINDLTVFDTVTTGNIKNLPLDQAKSVSRDFVNSFGNSDTVANGGTDSDEPIVEDVVEVDMYNPNMDQSDPVQKADLQGEYHIFDSNQVKELRSGGWYERGVGLRMSYKGRIYSVKAAGKERIGYVKVSDIEDIDRGRELLSNIRSRYLEHYRILTQT